MTTTTTRPQAQLRRLWLAAFVPAALLQACVLEVNDSSDDTTSTSTSTSTTNTGTDTLTSSTTGTGTGTDSGTDTTATDTTGTGTDSTGTGTDTSSTGTDTTDPMLGACDRTLVPTTVITEDSVAADTTWSGVVELTTNISVGDAVLTIAPGTTILVNPDISVEIGWAGSASTLIAQGGAGAPIHFCGKNINGTNVQWKGLEISRSVTSNSVLSGVTFEDAGQADRPALILGTGIKVENVSVTGSKGVGVEAEDFAAGSRSLSVSSSADFAVSVTGPGALTNFPLGGTFTGNAKNQVEVNFDSFNVPTTIHNVGIAYAQTTDVSVSADTTIDAGVTYLFDADKTLEIGWAGSDPSFFVNGTMEKPVVFAGMTKQRGYWGGVQIQRATKTNSKLSHLKISDAGANGYHPLEVSAAVALEHTMLEGNARGYLIGVQGLHATSTMVSATANGGPAVELEAGAMPSLPNDGSFVGNDAGNDVIVVSGGDWDTSATIAKQSVPYRVDSSITASGDAKLTIEAGAHFLMAADTAIEFGWAGSAVEAQLVGTADNRIVFEGVTPTAGSWHGLLMRRNTLSSSRIDFVDISHGGGDGSLLQLERAVPVTNTKFADSSDFAIKKEAEDTSDYIGSNTFTNIVDDKRVGDL